MNIIQGRLEVFTVEAKGGVLLHLVKNVKEDNVYTTYTGGLNIKNGKPVFPALKLTLSGVNGIFEHEFKDTSKEARDLYYGTSHDRKKFFAGGTFAFVEVDGNVLLLDYIREGGKVLADETIELLSAEIGTERQSGKRPYGGGPTVDETFAKHRGTTHNRSVILSSKEAESMTEIKVAGLGEGGEFKLRLKPQWSPFSDINFVLETIRLVCSNGMIGYNEALQATVPIYNQVQANLETARSRLMDEFSNVIHSRFRAMQSQRASISTAKRIYEMARGRSAANFVDPSSKGRLEKIAALSDPNLHLAGANGHYTKNAIKNHDLANTLPSHLTVFAAWNMLTEIDSHTEESGSSSSKDAQVLANRLVFEEAKTLKITSSFAVTDPDLDDPERAFFGE